MRKSLATALMGVAVSSCGTPPPPAATPTVTTPAEPAAAPSPVPSGPMDDLARAYVAGDAAAVEPLAGALSRYRVEGPPGAETDAFVDAMHALTDAARGGRLQEPELQEALLETFVGYRAVAPRAKHRRAFRALNAVVVAVSSPRWEQAMIERLERPIASGKQKALKDLVNEVFWQVTAAEVLGNIRSQKAIRPLIKVVLSPFKANIATTAINALVKIGAPAVAVAKGLLDGSDAALASYARAEALRAAQDRGERAVPQLVEQAALHNGIIIVGNIGTTSAGEALLAALKNGDATQRALIAGELYKVPANGRLIEAFKSVYGSVGLNDKIPPDDYAKESLLDSAPWFYDRKLNGFVLQDALAAKGAPEDVQAMQATALGVGIKTATVAQWPLVERLRRGAIPAIKTGSKRFFVVTEGGEKGPFSERQITNDILALKLDHAAVREAKPGGETTSMQDVQSFAMALHAAQYLRAMKNGTEVLDACGEDVDCFLRLVNDPANNQPHTAMKAEKAAYMAALLGGPEAKMKLAKLLVGAKSPSVVYTVLMALVRHSPRGDHAVVKALHAIVDGARRSGDPRAITDAKPHAQVLVRLRARRR